MILDFVERRGILKSRRNRLKRKFPEILFHLGGAPGEFVYFPGEQDRGVLLVESQFIKHKKYEVEEIFLASELEIIKVFKLSAFDNKDIKMIGIETDPCQFPITCFR